MPTISLTDAVAGTEAQAGLINGNNNTLETLLNGGIDNTNIASGAAIVLSKLGQSSATTNQVIQWNGSAWVPATISAGTVTPATSLPGSPTDKQQTILTDSTSAPTYYWLLQYNSTQTKWQFIGGIPLNAQVDTSETTTSTTYAALSTAGPSVTLPVAGDYLVTIGANMTSSGGANSRFMSYDIGGTGAVDGDSIFNTADGHIYRTSKKTGLTAVTLTAKYRTSATTGVFEDRFISVLPVKL